MKLLKLTGVYQADGGLVGELAYITGKLRGTAHCALCDITHGLTGKKRGFSACEASYPVQMELVHLNERSSDVRAFTEGKTPCVIGHGDRGLVMLLDARALDACAGSVKAFDTALRTSIRDAGFEL